MTTITLQYAAHTTKAGYASLDQTLLTAAFLYNTIIQQRNYASSSHRRQYDRRLTGRDITELANSEPEFQGLATRLLTAPLPVQNVPMVTNPEPGPMSEELLDRLAVMLWICTKNLPEFGQDFVEGAMDAGLSEDDALAILKDEQHFRAVVKELAQEEAGSATPGR